MPMRTISSPLVAAAILLLSAAISRAEVAQGDSTGFLVRHVAQVTAPPARVWATLVDRVGECWSPDHTFSGEAANLSIDARPGGCFCELLADGGGAEHLRVVYVAPGELLRMSGALGPLQGSGLAGNMTWELAGGRGRRHAPGLHLRRGWLPRRRLRADRPDRRPRPGGAVRALGRLRRDRPPDPGRGASRFASRLIREVA